MASGQNAEKDTHIKGRLLDLAAISSIAPLSKIRTSLKGKNLLQAGANSFLYEQFLRVWKITFTTLGYLPWMLLFLLRTCVGCIMGATPMFLKRSQIRISKLWSISVPEDCFDLIKKCRPWWNVAFCGISSGSWPITICQSTHLGFSNIQRVERQYLNEHFDDCCLDN